MARAFARALREEMQGETRMLSVQRIFYFRLRGQDLRKHLNQIMLKEQCPLYFHSKFLLIIIRQQLFIFQVNPIKI